MTTLNEINLGSERYESGVSTHLERLPPEILEIVVKHLPNPDRESFFRISPLEQPRTQYAVINVLNLKAIKELQSALKDVNPSKPNQVNSFTDFYVDFLAKIQDPNFKLRMEGVKIDDKKLQELQLQLTALATNQVAERTRKLKQECQQEIIDGASLESIEDKYSRLKCALVSEALELVVSSSVNPDAARDEAVLNAAEKGYFSLVEALLADRSLIQEPKRSRVFALAATNGHLEVVRQLLAKGEISEGDRGQAVTLAAERSHQEVVKALLANGKISEGSKGMAVINSAKNGHLEIVKTLLADGGISEVQRGWAVIEAAKNGHLEVVKYLLVNEASISRFFRSEAIKFALAGGHHSVADFLKRNQGGSCSVM